MMGFQRIAKRGRYAYAPFFIHIIAEFALKHMSLTLSRILRRGVVTHNSPLNAHIGHVSTLVNPLVTK